MLLLSKDFLYSSKDFRILWKQKIQFTFADSSISSVPSITSAEERSISVVASGIFVTVVKGKNTLIDF